MSRYTLVELKEFSKLTFETIKAPVMFILKNGKVICEFSNIQDTIHTSRKKYIEEILEQISAHQNVTLSTTEFLENFLSISIRSDSYTGGTLLIGPVLFTKVSEEELILLIQDNYSSRDRVKLLQYYKQLPVVNKIDLLNTSRLLYFLLYKEMIDITEIVSNQNSFDLGKIEIINPDLQLSKQRKDLSFHHSPLYEKEIFQCIKEGNKQLFIEKSNLPPQEGQFGVLSKKSYLRGQKNLAISFVTLATRAAIEGGLPSELAYTLSDLYIQTLEDIDDVNHLARFRLDVGGDFAERVATNKKMKYSRHVNICLHYIFTHLYEDITLEQLAKVAGTSTVYLSSLFKREVGTPLSKFIQQERIEEAKKLISLTNYSLTEICTMLNYNDQSYFTKVFKKVTGMTPKQFQNQTVK